MPLAVSIHEVPLDTEKLIPLFQQARGICDPPEARAGRKDCEDCRYLDSLVT